MNITCLMPDASQFLMLKNALEPLGAQCERQANEYMLLRRLVRQEGLVLLFDAGFDTDLEDRLLTWMECHPHNRPPIIWRCISYSPAMAVRALKAGAADVVDRSIDPTELLERMTVACRRPPQDLRPRSLHSAGFELDLQSQSIFDDGMPIEVSPREFALAWLLFSHAGTCLSRDSIGMAVWGLDSEISGRTMEQHMHRLRKKLGLVRARGVTLRAVYGQGYRLRIEKSASGGVQPTRPALIGPVQQGSVSPLYSEMRQRENDLRGTERPGSRL